jgi:hypothetical protein
VAPAGVPLGGGADSPSQACQVAAPAGAAVVKTRQTTPVSTSLFIRSFRSEGGCPSGYHTRRRNSRREFRDVDLGGVHGHAEDRARGSYDDSAHALAPRIERAVDEVCRQAGLVVVREPIGATLTEPLGVNLRNRIAHGLIGEARAYDAALLVHVGAFLRTLQSQERTSRETAA